MYNNEKKTQYFEKPITTDEQAVALLVETVTEAINTHNVSTLESIIAEDAQINFLSNEEKMLTKSEYMAYMTKAIGRIRSVAYSDIFIRVNGDRATIYCSGRIAFRNGLVKQVPRIFQCKKNDNNWLIIKTGYM